LALFCACAMQAQTPDAHTKVPAHHHISLGVSINALLADPKIAGAHWGISVTQLDGTSIYALNDNQLFQPASDVKLFTTAAALSILNPQYLPKTTVRAVLYTKGAAIPKGDVVMESNGDAFLSDRIVPYDGKTPSAPPTLQKLDELAEQFSEKLRRVGVTTINGDVVAAGLLPWNPYGDGWNADDLPWGYGAPVTGIVVNDNQVQLTITPATERGPATLTLAPDLPYYTLKNEVGTTDANTQTNIQVERDGRTLRITGTIQAGSIPDKESIAIDDPELYAATALKALLAQHGITITGVARVQRYYASDDRSTREIILGINPPPHTASAGDICGSSLCETPLFVGVEHIAPSLLDDVTATNKDSLNLHAELLLRKLDLRDRPYAHESTFAQGARVVRQFAINAGVNPDDFYFVDGSGLSTDDLATPRAFTQLLRYAATQPWGAEYKASLPIGGVDGTLETRFTKPPLKGNVFAKTGTSSEDRALSGYVVCASGKTVVFSILVGDHLPGSHDDRDVMDKIVAAIAAAN
jgi:D-alanyl-D-alanine carboxypeptidase/D-alanyl-D-alanine-endopeptidase (penicillin-binding protein 4)